MATTDDATSRSIPELVRGVVENGQRYVRAQRALVETELKRSGQEAGLAGAFAAVALVAASLFAIFLLLTLAWVLVELGLPTWAGFGIVALVLLVVALVAAGLAKSRAERITPPQLGLTAPGTPSAP